MKKREVVQEYLELKTAGVLFKKPDAEARQIMADIFASDITTQQPLFYHSRLLWLLEKFTSWLTPEIMSRPNALDISRNDIEKVRNIESVLTSDFFYNTTNYCTTCKVCCGQRIKLKHCIRLFYGLSYL